MNEKATTSAPGGEPVEVTVSSPEPERHEGGFTDKLRRLFGKRDAELARVYRDEDVTPIPPLAPGEIAVEMRPVRAPFAFVRIAHDPERNAYRYEVIEPPLSPEDEHTYAFVKDAFLRTLDLDIDALDRRGARDYLADRLAKLLERHDVRMTPLARARISYYLERDFLGFGPIDAMMMDGSIEDISCDGPQVPLFIFHRKYESVRTNLAFPTDVALDGFVLQLVQRSGKHISVAEPLVDATLPDGSRLQASLSREVTTRGSTFTIRKFRKDPFTPTDLMAFETASPEMVAYLWLAVEHGASGIICGGTASGKTTTLNALSTFIPSRKKIVSIEDTREINLSHENWIPGVTRAGGAGERNSSGKRTGEVDMFDLLKAALRQRPEYLLLGEVRGQEAYVLFQAMATGHTVYSTMHADSVASAVHRLESRPIEIPRNMLASLDFVVIQGETRVGERRVRKMRELVEITGIDPRTGELLTNRVFHWDTSEQRFRYSGTSFVLGKIAEETHLTEDGLRKEFDRRVRLLSAVQKRGARDIATFSRIVAAYAMEPDAIVAEQEAR
ncbi:MAG TPA: type II/IV secretion system ATPase subunit [Candidatus Thermoplasmatota archaeon]|nr:type II/IV secretion system ATPase subunit [Candidatus Thermoplasmatota archaeon]